MMTEEDQNNPFSVFDGEFAPMLAFCHMHYGVEGMRALLQMMVDPDSAPAEVKREYGEDWPDKSTTTQAHLDRYAAELEAVGLPHVAAIVAEYRGDIAEPVNPFEAGTPGWRDWNRKHTGSFEGFLSDRDVK